MRFLSKLFLCLSLFHLMILPALAKPEVLPVLGGRYKYNLADPLEGNDNYVVQSWYDFDHKLGQTENELITGKMSYQQKELIW